MVNRKHTGGKCNSFGHYIIRKCLLPIFRQKHNEFAWYTMVVSLFFLLFYNKVNQLNSYDKQMNYNRLKLIRRIIRYKWVRSMIIFHKLVKLSQLSIDVLKRYFQLIESMSIITLIGKHLMKNTLNYKYINCTDTIGSLGNCEGSILPCLISFISVEYL